MWIVSKKIRNTTSHARVVAWKLNHFNALQEKKLERCTETQCCGTQTTTKYNTWSANTQLRRNHRKQSKHVSQGIKWITHWNNAKLFTIGGFGGVTCTVPLRNSVNLQYEKAPLEIVRCFKTNCNLQVHSSVCQFVANVISTKIINLITSNDSVSPLSR